MISRLKKGFTLIEVMIVLVIIGVAAVIAVPSISNYISRTSDRACEKMMDGVMSNIRRAAVTEKFSSNAAVSIEIYKAVNELPMLRLRCPLSVSEADDDELAALNSGTLTGKPLEVKISSVKCNVEGEKYIVDWSFGANTVTVSMKCSSHENVAMTQTFRIYYGGDISDIISPPELTELKQMYAAAEQLLKASDENGEPLLTADENGRVSGDFAKAAEALSALCGREVESIESFRLSEGKPFLLYVVYTDSETMATYNFSSLYTE